MLSELSGLFGLIQAPKDKKPGAEGAAGELVFDDVYNALDPESQLETGVEGSSAEAAEEGSSETVTDAEEPTESASPADEADIHEAADATDHPDDWREPAQDIEDGFPDDLAFAGAPDRPSTKDAAPVRNPADENAPLETSTPVETAEIALPLSADLPAGKLSSVALAPADTREKLAKADARNTGVLGAPIAGQMTPRAEFSAADSTERAAIPAAQLQQVVTPAAAPLPGASPRAETLSTSGQPAGGVPRTRAEAAPQVALTAAQPSTETLEQTVPPRPNVTLGTGAAKPHQPEIVSDRQATSQRLRQESATSSAAGGSGEATATVARPNLAPTSQPVSNAAEANSTDAPISNALAGRTATDAPFPPISQPISRGQMTPVAPLVASQAGAKLGLTPTDQESNSAMTETTGKEANATPRRVWKSAMALARSGSSAAAITAPAATPTSAQLGVTTGADAGKSPENATPAAAVLTGQPALPGERIAPNTPVVEGGTEQPAPEARGPTQERGSTVPTGMLRADTEASPKAVAAESAPQSGTGSSLRASVTVQPGREATFAAPEGIAARPGQPVGPASKSGPPIFTPQTLAAESAPQNSASLLAEEPALAAPSPDLGAAPADIETPKVATRSGTGDISRSAPATDALAGRPAPTATPVGETAQLAAQTTPQAGTSEPEKENQVSQPAPATPAAAVQTAKVRAVDIAPSTPGHVIEDSPEPDMKVGEASFRTIRTPGTETAALGAVRQGGSNAAAAAFGATTTARETPGAAIFDKLAEDAERVSESQALSISSGDIRSGGLSAPAPAQAQPRTDHAASVMRQLADAMAGGHTATEDTIELRLSPDELGSVRFRMVQGEHGLTMNIAADRPETLDMLRRNIDQLSRYLSDLGYSSTGFTFGDGQAGNQSGGSRSMPLTTQDLSQLADPADTAPPLSIASGGLDLRI